MATSTRPTNRRENRPISPPDWSAEALVAHRALWEVAAMAGNVTPHAGAVKAKKSVDPEWKKGYEKIVRLMTNALSPAGGKNSAYIHFDPQQSGNAARAQDVSKLRQVRVDVTSAIEFIWRRYGDSAPPEGLRFIHQHLRLQVDADASKQVEIEATKDSTSSVAQPPASRNTAHRDQRLANATKEIKRLGALVYILSRELYGVPLDTKTPPPTLKDDVLAAIKSAGLERQEGFGPNGIQTLLQQSFHHFFQSKQ